MITDVTLDLETMRGRVKLLKGVADMRRRLLPSEASVLVNDNLALIAEVERLRDVIAGLVEGRGVSEDQFTCAECGETFGKVWSDEDATAEAEERFGEALGDDPVVVCDDCFKAMYG